jgi:hypothetical protein
VRDVLHIALLRRLRLLALPLIGLSLTFCTMIEVQAVRQPDIEAPPGDHIVPLVVIDGPQTGVLAFVPVYINDEGPFDFALDTGASRSVIDADVVEQLGLRTSGSAGPAITVTGVSEARLVRIDNWRVGDVDIPINQAVTLDLPAPGGHVNIHGLLGSDVLSTFDAITLDYDRKELVLRPRAD